MIIRKILNSIVSLFAALFPMVLSAYNEPTTIIFHGDVEIKDDIATTGPDLKEGNLFVSNSIFASDTLTAFTHHNRGDYPKNSLMLGMASGLGNGVERSIGLGESGFYVYDVSNSIFMGSPRPMVGRPERA
jgi:hypothetical protein